MTILIEVPKELEMAVEAEARRLNISPAEVAVKALERAVPESVNLDESSYPFPVFKGGVSLPHQTQDWWDNIRDVAYDRDDE